ncbi:MAG: T9SS type A sorting domain-containing protein [Bacteroidetes bacterium]|nr:T9SS type A sorting domain-containing protein [Bacteroidota bacterium]
MKNQLSKKLSAFIVIAMIFSASANAQIVYTDVNPNEVLSCIFQTPCSGDYSLDLNNDGINDFVLSARKKFVNCSKCGPQGGVTMANGDSAVISSTSNSWIADTTGGYALNTIINSSLVWFNAIHTLVTKHVNCVLCSPPPGSHLVYSPASGPWLNVSGNYLPLKIQVGTDFYYGWIKLGVSIGNNFVSVTIFEYAYNSIPNQPILAGQTIAIGITENSFASSISLFPNPVTNHLTIDLPNANKKVEVTIADVTGKIIYSTTSSETQKIEVNTQDFAEGVYVVQIQSADFIAMKKLVIEK